MFRHLHIVACSPRSGTTLLHEAMVTCFKVDKHYDHEVRFNLVTANDGDIVITKRPKDTMYMPDVIDDPELYVLYVMRDPRDVIVSRHGKNKDMYYSNIRVWRELHRYAQEISSHERFLQVGYEEFVNNPDVVQEQIVNKFPWLRTRHKFSEYHLHAEVSEKSKLAMNDVRPIAPTSVGKWKNNLPRIKAQQLTHGSLTPDLVDCGYETSAEWENVLADIEPDFSRSRYPENVYFWSRISQRINALRKVTNYRRMRRST
ncbi:MAG: sulfotransferase [Woeseiaceae bacterium]